MNFVSARDAVGLADTTTTLEAPIRAELFSVERLEQHAETLAAAQRVSGDAGEARLHARQLASNTAILIAAYRAIVGATRARVPITPAAEWLLDNFHTVDEQVREIRGDLPPGFYRMLPKLADGPLAGQPRVFGIAWAIVAHTDSAFDIVKLTRFVAAYQRVQPLSIGELWAIAITLRITLVENLRRLAEGIVGRLEARRQADAIADRILGTELQKAEADAVVLMQLEQIGWSTTFAVQLAMRLRDRDPSTTPALRWLNQRLADLGLTTDQIMRSEVEQQGATNVSVRNVITGMRLVSTINWAEWFESVSLIDAMLRGAGDFAAMDFPTRDTYRRAIEDIARRSGHDEVEIAARAIAAAAQARAAMDATAPGGRHEGDPGYYLISRGRPGFERQSGCSIGLRRRFFRETRNTGILAYIGLIGLATASVLLLGVAGVALAGAGWWIIGGLAVLGVVPASDVAVAVVNRLVSATVKTAALPGMELHDGVPPDLKTMVIMPTLLTSNDAIDANIERLEVHYLSNSEANVHFALLSDWADAPEATAATDQALLATARDGIARLNRSYGSTAAYPLFLLLHRRRVWNEGEGQWIGWERKRGKLQELNRLLRGDGDTSFVAIDGHAPSVPPAIRYVITLDADTRMPIGTVRRLIGKMAHPLNQPLFDPDRGRVVRGHAILQPRVTPSLPVGRGGSLFQRAFSGPDGLDPYAFAVSDVYQDLFEEGSYVGKGIYDVDVVERAMHGRIPECTVLSHDLLEGIFNRAGLVSDIEVVEEFPSRYDVAAARQHRWTRGDWQLLPWLFGLGCGGRRAGGDSAGGHRAMPAIGRWKLFDNLRRSLSAPATLLAFIIGWLLPLDAALTWTGFLLLTLMAPPLLPMLARIVPRRAGGSLHNYLRALREDLRLGLLQSWFLLVFLAHQAWLMVDAVMRSLYRQFVSRRRLLEWTTAAQTVEDGAFFAGPIRYQIGASAAFAVVVGVIIARTGQHAGWLALPFGVLWVLSPLIAWRASRAPSASGHVSLRAADAHALRLIGRRTWRFFETFVTTADNMLPPDNFQEDPHPVVAHRTSPTNIGLYLLSVIAARDFGWHGTIDTLDLLEASHATLGRLEMYRGHFYNWYDTQDLRALEPKYVSSVDSGNLAGHLMALGRACRELADAPAPAPRWRAGLRDTLDLIVESLREAAADGDTTGLTAALADFSRELDRGHDDRGGIAAGLDGLLPLAHGIVLMAKDLAHGGSEAVSVWAQALHIAVQSHRRDAEVLAGGDGPVGDRFATLAVAFRAMALAMEFGFLFDQDRRLLSIGYRGDDGTLDANFYDLLASEARLVSFFAIAKGDIPARHWFQLGRTLTPIDGGSGLISWSGSMFEYLMPSLVMRAPAGSLLEQTNRLVVRRQIDYGGELGVPWGMSESEYNARDIEQTYQYSSFGVPDLGYKRSLSESTVIAPYATALASMVDPAAAVRNYRALTALGARGHYGWYEALDYTSARLPEGTRFAIMRAYMAHHQSMSLVAIANTLHDGAMRARFHAEPMIKATELLLQERMPRDVALARPPPEYTSDAVIAASLIPAARRRYASPHSRTPRTQLLSNGRYAVMVTATGSGYSRWHDLAVSRWRSDPTCDDWGSYIYLRDVRSGAVWSAGYQPSGVEPDSYAVDFAEDRVEIVRTDGTLRTMLEIVVSPEDDVEVRRVSITNHGLREREIELTSCMELVIGRQPDDVAHPAFGKLFVETEFVAELGAIVATRRRRSEADPAIWAAHLVVVDGAMSGDAQFETDRARFIGRGRTMRTAAAVHDGWPLSNTVGPVLDAMFSQRRRVLIPRGATVRLAFWTMAASTRADVLDLADRHHEAVAFDRAMTLAWAQAQIAFRHHGMTAADAHRFQALANAVLYLDAALRPGQAELIRGAGNAATLWAQGISGDHPIVLVTIADESQIDLARQLLRAHDYWRLKRIDVDLVILNEHPTSYVQTLQTEIDTLVRVSRLMPPHGADATRGAVFVLRADQIASEIGALLKAAARIVLRGDHGSLDDQLKRTRDVGPPTAPPAWPGTAIALAEPKPAPALEFFNGLGGFGDLGREYVTILNGTDRTPAPWVNIIANPGFGFQVSTDGGGFTWAINSQQNQITPWSNDPVGDAPGEVIYLRDDATGEVWTATASPIRAAGSPYVVTHGLGFSRFEHEAHGVAVDLVQYVPLDDPIKISRLRITNRSGRARSLSVTAFVAWVLGASRSATAPFVITEIEPQTGALFAQNRWNDSFGAQVGFLDLAGAQTAWTGDRTGFIGRDGTLAEPLALRPGIALSRIVGAGLDPCGVLQTGVALAAGATSEVVVFLGAAADRAAAQALVVKYRAIDLDAVRAAVAAQWHDITATVQIETPDRALDIMVNSWLPYQTLASRVWARTGFYQASGAYGFRDQLQDVLSLCLSRPDIARAQVLRAAGRQFVPGDVQHWWLPDSDGTIGSGIRTRIADDRIWLAYATAHYVTTTGDDAVLDAMIPFLDGPVLADGARDAFFRPRLSDHSASLFEHCALALDTSLATGMNGLPLIGTGDWNDGMDRVGEGGKGESVWLGWFLYTALMAFTPVAVGRGETARAERWQAHAEALRGALERHGWDGDWYRRAFFDDGTPLGSAANTECRIDSIAQSWSVMSGAGLPAHAAHAMAAVDRFLVQRDDGLVLLFTPPFAQAQPDPGYIKGYPAGVRENGGQYTHAAAWVAQAFAELGDGDRAFEILSLINPINHARTHTEVHRYKVEPYVVSADIYSVPPHVGRGGWTWYTGSAGWVYRVAVERLLGLRVQGAMLHLDPCIPKGWPGFAIRFRHGTTAYDITVENPHGVSRGVVSIIVDDRPLSGAPRLIPLVDDAAIHRVAVVLGSGA